MTAEERARLRQRVREGGLFSYEAYALLDALDASEAELEKARAQRDSARALLRETLNYIHDEAKITARIKAELGE